MTRALVPLAQGCEELEAITITDLLTRAGIEVTTAGLDDKPVVASRGARLLPDTQMSAIMDQNFDLIVLPGGLPGADHLRDDENVQAMIKKQAAGDGYIGAICAAPKALAQAGVLEGKTATGYPGVLQNLKLNRVQVSESATEIDGRVVTSRGPGTAMDFTLTLIELLEGKQVRNDVEQKLAR